ncbi:DUF3833 domain-containing protein [Thiolinea disciformis]|uniref:DUF3833 domain-containing protein n=1 Tax=Thiolinea disciformis TaxID=125614 RepID=UPI00036345DC|nr:DUF3833 domain-containing protein [Thiolinea disciformis]
MKSLYQRWLIMLTGVFIMLGLSSCSHINLEKTPTNDQKLLLEDYFNGKTRAHGVLLDRGGAPQRYFVADILGTWNAQTQTLVLDESFVFSDGERSKRVWTIKKVDSNQYTGGAADVVGEAQGKINGNVFNWTYTLQVSYKGRTINVDLDDWMFLSSNNVLLNRAIMTKFGFKVGELVLSFEKL